MDFALLLIKNITLIIILSTILLILWLPVVYIVLWFCFFICGKNHVLTAWLNKFNRKLPHQSKLIHVDSSVVIDLVNLNNNDTMLNSTSGIDDHRPNFSETSFINSTASNINPSSGLPMVGSSPIDSGGNVYGTRNY